MTYVSAAEDSRGGSASYATRAGLIALMLLGALALWIGDPVLWLWITSRLQSGTQASMGPYGLMILGIILTAVVIGKGLARLNRFYGEVTGTAPEVKIVLPWRRSIRDARHGGSEDEDGRLPVSLLDVVMVIAVVIGVLALLAWFVIVQPAPPLPGGPGGAKH
jgi:hypothetical protein